MKTHATRTKEHYSDQKKAMPKKRKPGRPKGPERPFGRGYIKNTRPAYEEGGVNFGRMMLWHPEMEPKIWGMIRQVAPWPRWYLAAFRKHYIKDHPVEYNSWKVKQWRRRKFEERRLEKRRKGDKLES